MDLWCCGEARRTVALWTSSYVLTYARIGVDAGVVGLHLSRMVEWRRVLRGVRNYVVACLRSCRQGATDSVKSQGVVIACIPVPVSVFPGLLEGAGDAFARHALSLLGTLAPLLVLALAGLTLIPVWRVWSRHRLAGAGCWFELRLGEQVSRPALEAFTRTLAGGLPRPLLGAWPWVALSVSSQEDRATCGLFVSGGLSPAQVRASVEQALRKCHSPPEDVTPAAAGGGSVRLRVASLAPVGSRFLPLRVDHRVDPAGQLLASSASAGSQRGRRRAVGVAGPAQVSEREGQEPGRAAALRPRATTERLAARAPDGRARCWVRCLTCSRPVRRTR